MSEIKATHLLIEGRVQGVGYRAWLEGEARAAGLDGWVRNRRNGSVEALLSGPAGAVDGLIRDCHDGPPLARVDRVDATPAAAPTAPGFILRSTV